MHPYAKPFQPLLLQKTKAYRKKHGHTQEYMAMLFRISTRSYSDLENGKSCLSAPSFIFLLLLMSDDEILELMHELRVLVDELEQQECIIG